MKEADIRKYAALMTEFDLSSIEITEDGATVRLERDIKTAQPSVPVQLSAPAADAHAHSCVNAQIQTPPAAQTEAAIEQQNSVSVKSPMVGLFYAAPAENAEPYVTLGDSVTKGQTLCIVEAMKLMNEIAAEEDGIIEKICVPNGQMVEYGTELFRIRRQSA